MAFLVIIVCKAEERKLQVEVAGESHKPRSSRLPSPTHSLSVSFSTPIVSFSQIGEGAHGVVVKAKLIETGEIVALKKIPLRRLESGNDSTLPNTIIREIKALQQISHGHDNIVKLQEFFPTGGSVLTLVFEFMLSDLAEVLRNSGKLGCSHIKAYMLMLLKGVAYCHENNIMVMGVGGV